MTPCDRPECGTVAEVVIFWVTNDEENRAEQIRQIEKRSVSTSVSRYTGCRVHAREVWLSLKGRPRAYREIRVEQTEVRP
jgi:hypothetical protein